MVIKNYLHLTNISKDKTKEIINNSIIRVFDKNNIISAIREINQDLTVNYAIDYSINIVYMDNKGSKVYKTLIRDIIYYKDTDLRINLNKAILNINSEDLSSYILYLFDLKINKLKFKAPINQYIKLYITLRIVKDINTDL